MQQTNDEQTPLRFRFHDLLCRHGQADLKKEIEAICLSINDGDDVT